MPLRDAAQVARATLGLRTAHTMAGAASRAGACLTAPLCGSETSSEGDQHLIQSPDVAGEDVSACGYSWRSASIGSRLEALMAGNNPNTMPTADENPRPSANDHHGSEIGKPVA